MSDVLAQPVTDELGRAPISEWMKAKIDAALTSIPEGKRGAVVVIADEKGATGHLAAKINGNWQVAGGAGWTWAEKKPAGWVGVSGSW